MGSDAMRVFTSRGNVCIGVRVNPSAPRTLVCGAHGDRLKVAVAAPAEDNRANKELVEALAGWLGIDRARVKVVKGHASRDKVVAFTGTDEALLRERLDEVLSAGE